MNSPAVAIVTKARGTFFKPLYEAFAAAQPAPWRTLLFWPAVHSSEHPPDKVTPVAANLKIAAVESTTRGLAPLPSREIWRRLKRENLKGVLIHEFSPFTVQALMYAKWRRIPVMVSTEVGKGNATFFGVHTRLWHGFWGRFVNGVAACCPAAHIPLSGKVVPTVSTYHAVDSRKYLPLPSRIGSAADGVVIFAYLGQMIHRKGLDLWMVAAARLKQRGVKNFRLRIIGGGDRFWIERLAADLDLTAQVEFAGFLTGSSIADSLGSADAFVLPTRQDTYAAVVHEAACLGLPLLVSRHAGAAEALVGHNVNGFVFDPENEEEFCKYMEQLMDPKTRERMRPASRKIGEAYSAHLRGAALWEWMHENRLIL